MRRRSRAERVLDENKHWLLQRRRKGAREAVPLKTNARKMRAEREANMKRYEKKADKKDQVRKTPGMGKNTKYSRRKSVEF